MSLKFKLHITEYYITRGLRVSVHLYSVQAPSIPRDIFHSESSNRGTSSVLCGHAPSCMNPVVLTLLTPNHVQKGRLGVWFPSPLTYDPTKDHSRDFVALYAKAFNSQACTVHVGKTDFFFFFVPHRFQILKLVGTFSTPLHTYLKGNLF